jgi:hypothetical protein
VKNGGEITKQDECEPLNVEGSLLSQMRAYIEEHQHDRLDGLMQMNEKRYPAITHFKVEIFPNESKHPGLPHCKVSADEKSANFQIEDGSKLCGDLGHRERAASKAVIEHKKGLLDLWYEMRPDDQKLSNKPS